MAAAVNIDSVVAGVFRCTSMATLLGMAMDTAFEMDNAVLMGIGSVLRVIGSPQNLTSLVLCGSVFVFAPELAHSILVPRRTWVSIGIRVAAVMFLLVYQQSIVESVIAWSAFSRMGRIEAPLYIDFHGPPEAAVSGVAILVIAVAAFCCSDLIGDLSKPVPRDIE